MLDDVKGEVVEACGAPDDAKEGKESLEGSREKEGESGREG